MKKQRNIHKLEDSLPPTILTIFGATGSLSADYLLPAIFHMETEGLLPKDFKLIAVGRKDFNKETFLDFIIQKSKVLKTIAKSKVKQNILKKLLYFQGNFEEPESFKNLAKIMADKDLPKHSCYNRLFYFATSPQYFSTIAHILKSSGLLMSCSKHERQSRILVEKPFGFNLASAQALNKLLLKYFQEDQIYRIDHYVGKETVQNLMVARFANGIFEPLWNKENISHIEISTLYGYGIGKRGEYYDQTGALKDVVQNHVLQMLALLVMDEPKELTAEFIRNEKVKVLKSLKPFTKEDVKTQVVKGQYETYTKELKKQSSTETFIAFKAFINSPRWDKMPIYIRTGMNMAKTATEISVHFKEPIRCIFKNCAPNVLVFRIQPNESVSLQINSKIPGFGIELAPNTLEFGYKQVFKGEIPAAYERLILDFVQGDQRLFIRSDEIEAAWKFIDSISQNFKNQPTIKYKVGTNGPKESEELIKKDLKEWWTK